MSSNSFQWGASAWGLELFAPNDVEAFKRVLADVERLPFPSQPTVIEVFASMDKEGHSGNLRAAREMRKFATGKGFKVHACGFNPYLNSKGKPNPHLTSPIKAERKLANVLPTDICPP